MIPFDRWKRAQRRTAETARPGLRSQGVRCRRSDVSFRQAAVEGVAGEHAM